MWWIIALAVAILILLIVVVFIVSIPKFTIIQKLIDRLNLVTRENLSGMMVIRAFNKQGFEEQRFDKANKDLADVSRFINRVMATMMPVMMLVMNGLSVLIIWTGGTPDRSLNPPGGRYDGLPAIQYADYVCVPDAFDAVHFPSSGFCFR